MADRPRHIPSVRDAPAQDGAGLRGGGGAARGAHGGGGGGHREPARVEVAAGRDWLFDRKLRFCTSFLS